MNIIQCVCLVKFDLCMYNRLSLFCEQKKGLSLVEFYGIYWSGPKNGIDHNNRWNLNPCRYTIQPKRISNVVCDKNSLCHSGLLYLINIVFQF
jgi:hypothetical protein